MSAEFFKMAIGGGVGRVLERVPAEFADQAAFIEWAQKALPARRGDRRIWEWPEAVRLCDGSGAELYCWTLWDQIQAGKELVSAARP